MFFIVFIKAFYLILQSKRIFTVKRWKKLTILGNIHGFQFQ